MKNREIAEKIYNHLNEKGAGLGNVSVMLIESILNKVLPQANVIGSLLLAESLLSSIEAVNPNEDAIIKDLHNQCKKLVKELRRQLPLT